MGKKKYKMFTAEGHPISVYHQGKRHKLYVDMVTGKVVATNPIPIGMLMDYLPQIVEMGGAGVLSAPQKIASMLQPTARRKREAVDGELPSPYPRKTAFDKAMEIEFLEARRL